MLRPPPAPHQPPLRWWAQTWRLGLASLLGALILINFSQFPIFFPARWYEFLDLALGAVAVVVVAFRRRAPVLVNLVVLGISWVSFSASGAVLLGLLSLATRRRWVELLPIGVLSVLIVEISMMIDPFRPDLNWSFRWDMLVIDVAITVAVVAVGMYVGSRRELEWTLRDRAERAEAEQELRVAQARSTERTRIAREMHDVVAHRISLVSMHAGALSYRPDLSPEQRSRTAEVIMENARQALVDLRQVLGVLRDGAPQEDTPQPTLRQITDLVTEAREVGTEVAYHLTVAHPDSVPAPLGRAAFRVVREGLTNARKHAPGSSVSVEVTGDDQQGMTVTVSNLAQPGSTDVPGSGLGLIGLTERAELAGGHLTTRTRDGWFTLRCQLPWRQ